MGDMIAKAINEDINYSRLGLKHISCYDMLSYHSYVLWYIWGITGITTYFVLGESIMSYESYD